MSFKLRLIVIVLAAVVAIAGLNLVALHQVQRIDAENFAIRRALGRAVATTRLADVFAELDRAAVNLSKPREIVAALAAADNDALYDWSASFVDGERHDSHIASIAFVGLRGFVVARAPDEFHFGDTLADNDVFRTTLAAGTFLGTARIDGRPSMVAARTLRRYDDMPVGIVIVSVPITSEALSTISGTPGVVLTYVDGDMRISSGLPPKAVDADMREAVEVPQAPGRFHLAFEPDQRRARVLRLQAVLSFGAILASLLTLAALLGTLRRQLAPYQTIVVGLREYARHAADLGSLRDRIAPLRQTSSEIAQVADAVTQMIDAVDASFRSIARHTDQLETMARADVLTEIANRRGLLEAVTMELAHARRTGDSFAVILVDVDHFKSVNDRYGHPVGDAVLKQVADLLDANSRSTDTTGRWGGEEFLVLCPGADVAAASAHADNLRRIIVDADFPEGLKISASFGVTALLPEESLDEIIGRADRALYLAKSAGRNTVRAL